MIRDIRNSNCRLATLLEGVGRFEIIPSISNFSKTKYGVKTAVKLGKNVCRLNYSASTINGELKKGQLAPSLVEKRLLINSEIIKCCID